MVKNLIPAFVALFVAIIISGLLAKKAAHMNLTALMKREQAAYLFLQSHAWTTVVIALALRSIAGISVDPLIALPLGGLVTIVVTGNAKTRLNLLNLGLAKSSAYQFF